MSQEPEHQLSVAPHADDVEGPLSGPTTAGPTTAGPATARTTDAPVKRSERKARAAAARGGDEVVTLDAVVPAAQAYHVNLPAFEGPLDLLLHLIQQHELDIRDIPIAFISEKYVEYIFLMQELNIDLASEYLVMAATLAHIKSKLLLPTPPADQEEAAEEDIDPRAELIRRLLEYQKYKKAAEELGGKSVLGRDVFTRGAPAPTIDGPAPLAPISVFKLIDAFQGILKRVKQTAEHLIGVDRISISERITQLADLLRGRTKVRFEELFDENTTRADLVVTFLALLEMTRLRMTRVLQDGPLEPIFVELAVDESADSRMLDDYEPGPRASDELTPTASDYEEDEGEPEGQPLAAELFAASDGDEGEALGFAASEDDEGEALGFAASEDDADLEASEDDELSSSTSSTSEESGHAGPTDDTTPPKATDD